MASSIQGIDVGDAVLHFVADLSDLNAAIAQLNASMPAQLKPSGDAVSQLGKGFAVAGTSAVQAGQQMGAAGTSATATGTAIQILATRLMSEGLSAKDATSALVNLGYSQKEAATATGLTTVAVVAEDTALKSVARSAAVAGEATAAAGVEGTAGIIGMRQELMTVDQALGVRLPRGVTAFASTLPGIAGLMNAAFGASVVYFLVEALLALAAPVRQWISDTFILTAAQQALNAVIEDSQKAIANYNAKLTELQHQYELIGITGAAKTFQEGLFTAEAASNAKYQLNDLTNELYGLKNGLVSIPEAVNALNVAIGTLHPGASAEELSKLKLPTDADMQTVVEAFQREKTELLARQQVFDQQMANLNEEAVLEEEKQNAAAAEAKIAAAKSTGDALVEVQLQMQLLRNAQLKVSYYEDAIAQKTAADEKYQIELKALQDQETLNAQEESQAVSRLQTARALYAQDPTKNASLLQSTDQQILDVEREYSTKRIQIDAEITTLERENWAQQLTATTDFINKRKTIVQQSEDIVRAAELKRIQEEQQTADTERSIAEKSARDQLSSISDDYAQQQEEIQKQADLGVITEEQKAQKLAVLYKQEEKEALDALKDLLAQEKEEVDTAQASRDAAIIAPFFSQENLDAAQKNLDKIQQAYADTSTKILDKQKQFDAKYNQQDDTLLKKATSSWKGFFQVLLSGSISSSHAMQAGFYLMTQALANSVAAAVSGSSSFGQAMEDMAKQTLAALAEEATVQALEALGWAFYYLGVGDYVGAQDMFTSAAEFGAVAAAAAVTGAAIPSGSSSSSSSSSTAASTTAASPATVAGQQPVQTVNPIRLALGALVGSPMLALIGDAVGGGSATEAVLPLENSEAMQEVGSAIADNWPAEQVFRVVMASMTGRAPSDVPASLSAAPTYRIVHTNPARSQSGSGSIADDPGTIDAISTRVAQSIAAGQQPTNVVNVNIDLSKSNVTSNINRMANQITKAVKKGTARLISSNSLRVTKRGS